jgi:hypothetical protein
MAHHSSEARRVRRELDKEPAATAAATGRNLAWSAAELQVLELITAAIDRKVDLSTIYAEAKDPKARAKLAAEIRLTEAHIARLLKQIKTDVPQPMSNTSRKAQIVDRGSVVQRIPGLYEHIRAGYERQVAEGDPRVPCMTDDPAERAKINAGTPIVRQATHMLERMQRREPVTIARSQLGGHSFPEAQRIPWIADRWNGIAEIVVTPDDVVRPAERRRNDDPVRP